MPEHRATSGSKLPADGPSTAAHPKERYPALDGLRGIAALAVVVCHGFLVDPQLADAMHGATQHGLRWWLTATPLRLLWAGNEAVTVFFVLSGFVLTLPFTPSGFASTWRSYYPQRLIRLYPPLIAAVGLAALSYSLVNHSEQAGASWWMAAHDIQPTAAMLIGDMTMATGTSIMNSVTWSLRVEVIFSLALPLVVFAIVKAGRSGRRVALAIGCLSAIGVLGALDRNTPMYLMIFVLGAVVAVERHRIGNVLGSAPRRAWWAILPAAAMLLLVRGWPVAMPPNVHWMVSAAGAVLVLLTFIWNGGATRFGRTAVAQWVGQRSFSLYLVHEPIVVCTALLLHSTNPIAVLCIAAPAALIAAALFYRLVERPSWRAARHVGRLVASRPGRAKPGT